MDVTARVNCTGNLVTAFVLEPNVETKIRVLLLNLGVRGKNPALGMHSLEWNPLTSMLCADSVPNPQNGSY